MNDFAYFEGAKKCPFCGYDVIAALFDNSRQERGLPAYTTECQNCHASTGYFKTQFDAEDAWQSRT